MALAARSIPRFTMAELRDNPEVTGEPVPVTVRIPPLDPLTHGAAYFNAIERSSLHGKLLNGLRDYYR